MLRAWARDQAPGAVSDRVKVERHLRKLARSMAAKQFGGKIVQKINKRGQMVTDMRIRVLRGTRSAVELGICYETGELREFVVEKRYRRYVVGYYLGGSGFLSVNDGRLTAANIARILGALPEDRQTSYELVA